MPMVLQPDGSYKWQSDFEQLAKEFGPQATVGQPQDFNVGDPNRDEKELERQRQTASKPIVQNMQENVRAHPWLAEDEQWLASRGKMISEAESKVVLPKPQSVVKLPGRQPMSAEAAIRATAPVLTPEQIQGNLLQRQNEIIGREAKRYEQAMAARRAASVQSGMMDGKRARMAVAADDKYVKPETLDRVEHTLDVAMGLKQGEVSAEDLALTMDALTRKGNITGLTQDMERSKARLELAIEKDLQSGIAKVDAAIKGPKPPSTVTEWNQLLDSSFSPLTKGEGIRRAAQMRPPNIYVAQNLDEANVPPFRKWLQDEKHLTPEEATKVATVDSMHNDTVVNEWYEKFKTAKPWGSFYLDGNNKVKEHVPDAAVMKLEEEKESQRLANEQLASGVVRDETDPFMRKALEDAGAGAAPRFMEEIKTFDVNKIAEGTSSPRSGFGFRRGSVENLITTAAKDFDSGKNVSTAIKSAITRGIKSGDLTNVTTTGAYSKLANQIKMGLQTFYKDRIEQAKRNAMQANLVEMQALNNRLVEVVDKNLVPNRQLFPKDLSDAQARQQVIDWQVTQENMYDKAKDLLLSKLGILRDSVQGKTLDRALSLPQEQREILYRPVQIVYDRIMSDLWQGLYADYAVQGQIEDEKKKRDQYKAEVEAQNKKDGKITVWDETPDGKLTAQTFRADTAEGRQNAEEWRTADEQQRKNILKREDDFAKKELELSQEINKIKAGYVATRMPQLKGFVPKPESETYGFQEQSIRPEYESDWDYYEDILAHNYSGHPELMDAAMEAVWAAKDKWRKDIAKKYKWTTPEFFTLEENEPVVPMASVEAALREVSSAKSEQQIRDIADKYKIRQETLLKIGVRPTTSETEKAPTMTGKWEIKKGTEEPPRFDTKEQAKAANLPVGTVVVVAGQRGRIKK